MKMKPTKLSPREAKTFDEVCLLQCDNKAFGKADILIHEDRVSIWPESKTSEGWIVLSKRDFNRMIDWYNKEQLTRKK